jgi:predicted metalloprotease
MIGNQRASGNVEDRRGMGAIGGGLGIGGIVIALIAYFLGVDPGVVTNVAEQVATQQGVWGHHARHPKSIGIR